MDNLFGISESKAIDREVRKNSKAVYTGTTNAAAKREAFVSDLESRLGSESTLFLKLA
jgi:hypothetical protein